METKSKEDIKTKRQEIIEKTLGCYEGNDLNNIDIDTISSYSGLSAYLIYEYFDSVDDLIIKTCEYCRSKIEADFLPFVPDNIDNLYKFIEELPYWSREKHGKIYRLMYQLYNHSKYHEYSHNFYSDINKLYLKYLMQLKEDLKISENNMKSLVVNLIKTCAYYSYFEDEFFTQAKLSAIRGTLDLFLHKNVL